jgi:lipoate---protein ligase
MTQLSLSLSAFSFLLEVMLRLLAHTADSPALDLALEEAIQLGVEDGSIPNTWRLWQPRMAAAIIGTGQEAAREVDLAFAGSEGVPVLRRHSGGGAVVIGPGIINFSAFYLIKDLPGAETIRGAMSAALKPVIQTLARWKLQAQEAGLSDLAIVNGETLRKIGGNAQARKRLSVVVHGTLLADPDWARLARLLPYPSKPPEYRAGREHRAFLTSLRENKAPSDLASFCEGLASALPSDIVIEQMPKPDELARARQLLREKYASPEWNFRR